MMVCPVPWASTRLEPIKSTTTRGAAQSGGFAPASSWAGLLERLRAWVRAEASAGRLLPWVPIAFGNGIALYFTAPREPVLSVSLATSISLCAVAFLLRCSRFFAAAVILAAIAAGFATLTLRTVHLAQALLARPLYSVSLSGFVGTRDICERTGRFVLRVTQMDAPRFSGMPPANAMTPSASARLHSTLDGASMVQRDRGPPREPAWSSTAAMAMRPFDAGFSGLRMSANCHSPKLRRL